MDRTPSGQRGALAIATGLFLMVCGLIVAALAVWVGWEEFKGARWTGWSSLVKLVVGIAGVGVILAGLAVIVRGRSSAACLVPKLPRADRRQSRNSSMVGWLFIATGVGVFLGIIVPKSLEWLDMWSWEQVPGEVISSRVETSRGKGRGTSHSPRSRDKTSYSVEVDYRYSFKGREYSSNRYELIRSSSTNKSSKENFVRNHPKGAALQVWVDPEKPWRAIVKRNPGSTALLVLFPVVFCFVGYLILMPTPPASLKKG